MKMHQNLNIRTKIKTSILVKLGEELILAINKHTVLQNQETFFTMQFWKCFTPV
jgi:hypothetical protein